MSSDTSSQVKKLDVNEHSDRVDAADSAPSELVAQVDDLLNQLSSKFSNLSGEILGKMDEMSRRLDNLEATIQAANTQGKGEGGN
ncbi:hypothetical protein M433DRAFT_157194 [Acidomyces richmondensis BFW]|nr:MAG: hypothetical protein FE78DRAFT_94360 [Acidomyces sp. 'richmondensis']KYG43056.1 hypothetical protein M433DRAFT_157194 [Acidomyces richmondensis BFW]